MAAPFLTTSNLADLAELKAQSLCNAAMLKPNFPELAARIVGCQAVLITAETGSGLTKKIRPIMSMSCRSKWCLICEANKSKQLAAKFRRVEEIAKAIHPDFVWSYCVITTRDPVLNRTRSTLDGLNKAIKFAYGKSSAIGYFRSHEWPAQTFNEAEADHRSRVHTHSNLLFLVPAKLGSGLGSSIESSLKAFPDFRARLDSCQPVTAGTLGRLAGYGSKPTPLSFEAEYLRVLEGQLKNIRRHESVGSVKWLTQAAENEFAEWKEAKKKQKTPHVKLQNHKFDPANDEYVEFTIAHCPPILLSEAA